MTSHDVTPGNSVNYDLECFMYQKRRFDATNGTFIIASGHEGVPEIFLLNVISFLIIIVLFSVLRKKAWHYGRLALLHRKRSISSKRFLGYDVFHRIMQVAKSTEVQNDNVSSKSQKSQKSKKNNSNRVKGSVSPNDKESSDTVSVIEDIIANEQSKKSSRTSSSSKKAKCDKFMSADRGFFGWIPMMFKLTDEIIAEKCGQDSVHYAMFQRYLIVYLLIFSFVALTVILPIHAAGDITVPGQHFARFTIANIDSDSQLIWFHCFLLFGFNVVCVFFLRHFASKLQRLREEEVVPAIMITDMDEKCAGDVDLLKKYFEEAYPKYTVTHINFAYDVKNLKACQVELKNVIGALRAVHKTKINPRMRVTRFSKEKVLCSKYYETKVISFKEKLFHLKNVSDTHPLPICFVSFEHLFQAIRVFKDFSKSSCGPIKYSGRTLPATSFDESLKPKNWTVSIAPDPDDILWENFSVRHWHFRSFMINIVVFLALFFLTTPSMFMIAFSKLGDILDTLNNYNSLISEGIAVVLLVVFACLLPYIVSYAEYCCRHWTQSNENLMVIRKVTIFLLFMVLILPSVSVASARIFAESIFVVPVNGTNEKWGCIFLPQNGAFFTNYIISSTWITVAMEFVRLSTLLNYGCRRLFARSKFERFRAAWFTVWAFSFGDNYAWMLLIFTITIVYGVFFPLILPIGFTYFLFKYFVDRYNIFFAFTPGKISKEQHLVAMNFVLFSFLLAQFVLFLYLYMSTSLKKFRTLFVLVVFMFSTIGYIWHCMFGWIWYGVAELKPITGSRNDDDDNVT